MKKPPPPATPSNQPALRSGAKINIASEHVLLSTDVIELVLEGLNTRYLQIVKENSNIFNEITSPNVVLTHLIKAIKEGTDSMGNRYVPYSFEEKQITQMLLDDFLNPSGKVYPTVINKMFDHQSIKSGDYLKQNLARLLEEKHLEIKNRTSPAATGNISLFSLDSWLGDSLQNELPMEHPEHGKPIRDKATIAMLNQWRTKMWERLKTQHPDADLNSNSITRNIAIDPTDGRVVYELKHIEPKSEELADSSKKRSTRGTAKLRHVALLTAS